MGLRATVPTPQIPHTGPRFEIPRPFLDDFDTDHEELPVDPYPPAPQTPEEVPSTTFLSWPADPAEATVNNEESVASNKPKPRDETSEEWSDEVPRQRQACTALETEIRDRATTQFLACVQRMAASHSEDHIKEIIERKEKRLSRKRVIAAIRHSWYKYHGYDPGHTGASSSTDQQP